MAGDTSPEPKSTWRLFFETHFLLSHILEDEMISGQGISFAWYDVLLHLAEAPGRRMRMNELADSLVWSRSWLTRRLDQMEYQGLVRRESDKSDRRGSFAVLTPKGLQTFHRTSKQHLADIDRHFYAHLTASDVRVMRRALEKVLIGEGGVARTHAMERSFQSSA
jgi:DNA-binding MarR family transcriptional regulator